MKVIITTILFYHVSLAQLVYPDDRVLNIFGSPPTSTQQARGINTNDQIDLLLSQGITNLAISINNLNLNENKNVVFSPVSIASALALLLLASNGRTFQELTNVMGLSSGINVSSRTQDVHEHLGQLFKTLERNSADFNGIVRIAAAIFVENYFPIRSLYKDTSTSIYRTEIRNLGFSSQPGYAQNVINNWVNEKTNGKITNIIDEPPPADTKVIIVSALYFNGAWEMPFFDGSTRRRNFYPNGRKSQSNIQAEMMANGGQFPYYKDQSLNCEIMGFPYKGNETTLYVIMPSGSNKEVLKQFERRLTANDIERLISNTKYRSSVVLFPKMRLESTMSLKGTLQNLGVNALFNPQLANLALLSPGPGNLENRSPVIPQNHKNNRNEFLIFNRFGNDDDDESNDSETNCTQIFDPNSNITRCEEVDKITHKQVTYKKFGDKVGRRVTRQIGIDSLDKLRSVLNGDPSKLNVENPGLYADKVLHKVYIDITETGTEAAAVTSTSLYRGGDIVTFRVDVPFLFFIRNEQTRLTLFWGTVYEPTPNYRV
ncbi:serine protease inhibitor 28Dc [Onthophagus taurus]|uniref:serine protease inhibitor 28Dc n=1 Tax=Onthophagus taurus TaxID=166361 RepID=UPI000C20C7FA|nr:serine protease inhibitor 28Dc [Onthophagus taurus]